MSEVSIKFSCECGKAYKVSDKFAGKRVKCKQCGETVTVPSTSSDEIPSQRAASISQSAVLKSGPNPVVKARREPEPEPEADPEPRKSAKPSSAKGARTSPGGDTVVFEAPDISMKLGSYQRKREEPGNRKGEGKIVLYEDDKATKTFRLDRTGKVIGRSPKCDIVVEHPTVSKEHVRLEYTMGMYIATDNSSTNGMVVNGKRIRRASLKDNDVVQLGEAILRIDCS
jgi:hypothetical protein